MPGTLAVDMSQGLFRCTGPAFLQAALEEAQRGLGVTRWQRRPGAGGLGKNISLSMAFLDPVLDLGLVGNDIKSGW